MAVVPNTLKGFGVTLKQVFKKPITQQYPEYKRPVYPRYRGRHRLHLHENGLEKCVGCSLCAAACPADCIRVVPAENTADNRVSAGERYARIYEINLSRCIFCGYCELACPFDAITLGNEFEISEYNRDDLIYTKDMLLAPPMKRVPVADRDLYDTPIPYYKDNFVVANFLVWCVWFVAAFACLASALAVVTFRNPFYSALSLIGNLASLAVLFLLLSGEFVAAGQVLVYGGAVMVMFLFVIAYLGDRSEESPWSGGPSWQVARRRRRRRRDPRRGDRRRRPEGGRLPLEASATIDRGFGSPEAIGRLFLTDHLLAFEVTSIVLLVAAVGGVVLGSHARAAGERCTALTSSGTSS